MKRIVVTGATSMIGISIIGAMLNRKDDIDVYAVVRPGSSKLHLLPDSSHVHIIECDASGFGDLAERIGKPCDIFYHMAWTATGANRNMDILGQCKNIGYTLKAITAAKKLGCKKFIGAGSQAEYGLLDLPQIAPDSPVNPKEPYGIAKYATGKLGAVLAGQLGMDFIWVRVFSVYGPHDLPTTMVRSTIRKLQNGEKPSFTPATQLWDYLYSADAGEAFCLIGEKSAGNKVYCLGGGNARPLREYIEELRDVVAPGMELGIGDIPFQPGAVMNLCADISGLTQDTGWMPKRSFTDGIRDIIK